MEGVPVAQPGIENVIKTGYLKKGRQSNRLSSAFKRTPRRWFVYGVRDGTLPFLEYYESEAGTFTSTPINSFDLTGCKKITYVLSPRNPSFTFCIVLQDRVIELTALTRSDLIDWCDRMERSLRELGYLETLRGPDDEHVYVDAPFLQKRNKSSVVVEGSSNEGDIHTSASEVTRRVTRADSDHPEEVPGMIYLPSISRNRPVTIGGWDFETFATLGDRGGSLERGTSRDAASQERRRSLERGPSLDSFLVEEKDNRSSKHPSKGLVRRSTIAVPRRNVPAMNKAENNSLVNGFELDSEGPSLLQKPKQDVSNGNAYGNLSDWTSLSRTNNYLSVNSDSPEATSNNNNNNVDDKVEEDSTLGFYKTDENDNHTCPEEDLRLGNSRKPMLPIKSPNLFKPFSVQTELVPSPVEQTSSSTDVCITPASPLSPVGSLSDCLPDDEQVHHNVRQLLKFFENSKVSGSSEPDQEDAVTNADDTGAQGMMTYDKPAMLRGETDDEVSVFASLMELGMAVSSEPPGVPEQGAFSKLLISNFPTGQTECSANNQSRDMGYMSDKSPYGAEGSDSTVGPTSDFSGTDALPERTRYMKKKDMTPGETDVPPPLPNRPANLTRLRPTTMSPGRLPEPPPDIPPRRSLSVIQQVSNCSGAQSVVPLKTSQVELFRNNITSPVAKPVELRRRDCLGTIAFVDAFGSVWIAGWNQRARPRLHGAFHLGDRLLSINNEPVKNAAAAQKFIKQCSNDHLVLEVKTAPKAKVVCVQRSVSGQSLGFKRDGGTAEIIYIDPNGLAAQHGLASRASTMDNSGFCNWVLTEINSRPLNLFLKKNEIAPMLDAVGLDISLVVQPVDFVGALKRQLKHLKNYKDYILP